MGRKKCLHGIRKEYCKECGGGAYCVHGIRKYHCKECGGSGFCPHGIHKYRCKECGGSAYCVHGIRKEYCRECGGSGICPHGINKYRCKECGGSSICLHGINKYHCKECGGGAYCVHGINKYSCRECGGGAYCVHDIYKQHCKICGGSKLCKSSWCETKVNKNKLYEGYCLPCFIHNPENDWKPAARNYKTKEIATVDYIREIYPDFDWIADKRIQGGCSNRRPDLLVDFGSHIIIIEIDENKHTDYDSTCEVTRLNQLSIDLHHRPIVLIRFNPDAYVGTDGKKVSSCWRLNKLGVMSVVATKKNEWIHRLKEVVKEIEYSIANPPKLDGDIVTIIYKFY
jgi:hypothetical protein